VEGIVSAKALGQEYAWLVPGRVRIPEWDQAQWLTPIISTSQEAEIRRIMFADEPGQKITETTISTS
jgi:hypothetical protein